MTPFTSNLPVRPLDKDNNNSEKKEIKERFNPLHHRHRHHQCDTRQAGRARFVREISEILQLSSAQLGSECDYGYGYCWVRGLFSSYCKQEEAEMIY